MRNTQTSSEDRRKRTREVLTLVTPWVPTLKQAAAMSAKYNRVIVICIFGLLGSAMIGGLITAYLASFDSDSGVWLIFGVPAGMFSFACLRLWLAAPSPKNSN